MSREVIAPARVAAAAAALDRHRWKTMGVDSTLCECGEVVHGDAALTTFPADVAFREHIAVAMLTAAGFTVEL